MNDDDEAKYDRVERVMFNGRERVKITIRMNGQLFIIMMDPDDLESFMLDYEQRRAN